MDTSNKLAVIILAAGTSSRLGEPKQLVKIDNKTLLEIAVKKALEISDDVFVVLGHEKEKCEKVIENEKVTILFNENYKKGIGSSLSFAVSNTLNYDNTLIMLCDQPFIPNTHFEILKSSINEKNIIASHYGTLPTVPAIFPKKYYKKLLKLDGDKGAKSILQKEDCFCVKLDKKFAVDIDTKEDIK